MVFHRDTPFLRPAIASVLGQTVGDLELVLVDNGAALASDQLGALARDPRVRWVRLPTNAGIAAGINAGVAAARADFVALLDYDDVMLPDRLAKQLAWLRDKPALGLVGSGAEVIDGAGNVIGREFCLVDEAAHREYSAFFSGAIAPSTTGRTEVFRMFPHRAAFRWASDFDFAARVVEKFPTAAVPAVLLRYRRYAGQTTVTRRTEQILEEAYVRLLTARRRSGRPEDFDAIARELASRRTPRDIGEIHREFAARLLAEGFARLAVYHARRLVIVSRNVRAVAGAARIVAGAIRGNPRAAPFLARLFFCGPLHALGLRNDGAALSRGSG